MVLLLNNEDVARLLEMADVLSGKTPGRTDDRQIILYKNQGGQGIIDIALAKKC